MKLTRPHDSLRPIFRAAPLAAARLPYPGQSRRLIRSAYKAWLIVEIAAIYASLRPLMARREIQAVVSRARQPSPLGTAVHRQVWADSYRDARYLGGAVGRTLSVLPTDDRCLIQSLVLLRVLALRGIAGTLVIGARSDPRFQAHAWVECDGRPVLPVLGFGEARLLEI